MAWGITSQAREYLRKAKKFLAMGDLVSARDFSERARKIDPEAEQISAFEKKLKLQLDKKIEELKRRGDFHISAKELNKAQICFQQILVFDPENRYSMQKITEINKVIEKIQDYERQGIQIDVKTGRGQDVDFYSAVSLLNQAKALFSQGKRDKALELIEQVLEREPGYKPAKALKKEIQTINKLETFINKAEENFKLGKMRAAIDLLDKLILKSPEKIEFLLMRAKANIKIENYKNARADLWKYYKLRGEGFEDISALFATIYYGLEKYKKAYAFSFNPETGKAYKPLGFRYSCITGAYPLWVYSSYLFLIAFFVSTYYTWKTFGELWERFPAGIFYDAVSCAKTVLIRGPLACLEPLIVIAKNLNVAWLNYLVGISLLSIGQLMEAQRFLTYSVPEKSLAVRAHFFLGLIRKKQNQSLFNNDFEEALIASTENNGKCWYPLFLKRLEKKVLLDYSNIKESSSVEGLASIAIKEIMGEL